MLQPTSSYIRANTILHFALLAGQFLMAIIFLGLVYFKNTDSFSLQSISQQLLIACIAIAALAYLGGNFSFKKKLETINEGNNSLSKKLDDYRSANITRWAIMEFATLFSIIVFFLTGNYSILIVAAVMMALFFAARPASQKAVADLHISLTDLDDVGVGSDKYE